MGKSKAIGLTLIEVLVALMVVSVAMTAILWTLTQKMRATAHLQDKTVALLVGNEVLSEVRLGLLPVSGLAETPPTQVEMLGQSWWWQLNIKDTTNVHIKKVIVRVFSGESQSDSTPTLELVGYVKA
jgi:general secretion pathway protein I